MTVVVYTYSLHKDNAISITPSNMALQGYQVLPYKQSTDYTGIPLLLISAIKKKYH